MAWARQGLGDACLVSWGAFWKASGKLGRFGDLFGGSWGGLEAKVPKRAPRGASGEVKGAK